MEKINITDINSAITIRRNNEMEQLKVKGFYVVKCLDVNGNTKWEDTIENIVTDVGANMMLDQMFGATQNSTYFLGLISSVGYVSVPVVANTMASHATWVEAGNGSNYPTWTSPASNARATITWSAASSRQKALSSSASFTIATGGTVKGCFVVTGSGAVSTNNSTAGTLYSAGTFAADKIVDALDTLQVSYTTQLQA